MKILVTGFEPFDQEKINPSYEAVKALEDHIGDFDLIKKEIPCVRQKSYFVIKEYLEKEDLSAIILVGQAGGRKGISLEKIAVNMDDYRIPDNEGNQPKNEIIVEDGPAAYFSTLPIEKFLEKLTEENIDAHISYHAGTYVCNHVFYQTMHALSERKKTIPCGFIHVPYIPEQGKDDTVPIMSLEEITRALKIMIENI